MAAWSKEAKLMVAGTNASVAIPPDVAQRLESMASADGVTTKEAASIEIALGASLPAHTRRLLRLIMEEGGDEAISELLRRVAHATAVVGNLVMEHRLVAHAGHAGVDPSGTADEEDAAEAVELVRQARRHARRTGDTA